MLFNITIALVQSHLRSWFILLISSELFLQEELEEGAQTTIYDNFKFLTKEELERLNLTNLIGTNLVRAYMHGFFIDYRLYKKVKLPHSITNFSLRLLCPIFRSKKGTFIHFCFLFTWYLICLFVQNFCIKTIWVCEANKVEVVRLVSVNENFVFCGLWFLLWAISCFLKMST